MNCAVLGLAVVGPPFAGEALGLSGLGTLGEGFEAEPGPLGDGLGTAVGLADCPLIGVMTVTTLWPGQAVHVTAVVVKPGGYIPSYQHPVRSSHCGNLQA